MVNPKFKPGMKITAYLDNYLYESINNKAKAYDVRGLTWRYHPSSPESTPIKLDSLYELRNNLEKVLNTSLCDTYHSHDNIHNVDNVRDKYRCVHDYVDNADSGHDNADSIDGGYDSIDFADNFKKDHSVLSTYDQSYDTDKSVTGKYHCTSYDSVDTQDSETKDVYYYDVVNSRDITIPSNSAVNANNSDHTVDWVHDQTCVLNVPGPKPCSSADAIDNVFTDYIDNTDRGSDDLVDSDYSDYNQDNDDNSVDVVDGLHSVDGVDSDDNVDSIDGLHSVDGVDSDYADQSSDDSVDSIDGLHSVDGVDSDYADYSDDSDFLTDWN